MSLLYPRLKLTHLPLMMRLGVQGAIVAGVYGIVHDQITYTISPEYFTEFKAEQFRYMDFGWPERVYAGQIGFMATWWVGFIAGWFLARLTVPHVRREEAVRCCWQGFGMLFGVVVLAGMAGAGVGWWETRQGTDPSTGSWMDFARSYGVRDVPGFIRAACIHNGSYLGALLGLTGACFYTRRRVRSFGDAATAPFTPVTTSEKRTI
ncbi:hypothetical protein DES53_102977 [Roseimicrobium gellanilyticum]|uniref:Uncharacterized protein n=1 Tax=Roseimicrobium gellanilyticum TaxID=748857 RepID=A0A366HSW3_9BACT|nr:hypothetical protein [Roseimicrobium gellanilyticum]RBP46586.1 hypothetical protein DES53_102977 [Roseimicrobium gellanilyticum]